jgi:hypothetical protein
MNVLSRIKQENCLEKATILIPNATYEATGSLSTAQVYPQNNQYRSDCSFCRVLYRKLFQVFCINALNNKPTCSQKKIIGF